MKKIILPLIAALAVGMATTSIAAPFGGAADVDYAKKLWDVLKSDKLVGDNAVMSTPYTGVHPHGAVLDSIDSVVTVDGKDTGVVIIKRNYGGKDVTKAKVADAPADYLKAVTVMFKRNGYDPEDKDWFWVKYAPDGSILKNPKDMFLAGMVAKGKPQGCISCHKGAPGGDMVFNNNRFAK